MIRLSALAIAFCLALTTLAQASPVGGARSAPEERALQWLALIDAADYDNGIKQMGKQARPTETAGLQQMRGKLGAVQARKFQDITLTENPQGLPTGQYAVLSYETRFANRAQAVETVTLSAAGANWTVVRYAVK